MILIIIITLAALVVSFFANRQKTIAGLKKGAQMFLSLLFPFLSILIFVSIFLAAIPEQTIIKWLGSDSGLLAYFLAAIVGSISLIPGFIVFPMSGILVKMGVGYPVIAIFITTLMMVGIFTLPLEAKYFGWKTAIIRNSLSFIAAMIVGLGIGFIWRLI